MGMVVIVVIMVVVGVWLDQPLSSQLSNTSICSERTLIEFLLRTLIDDGALVAWKRRSVSIRFKEVLAHFWPDILEQEPQMRRYRIVA
jgi:hypothetical protein